MRSVCVVDVAVACVFNNVTLVVCNRSSPVATVVANNLACCWITIGIKSQRLVGSYRCPWQGHVNAGWICLWSLQCSCQTFSILLCKDGLLIHLIVHCVGKEVTTSYKVSSTLNGAVTNNSNLSCTSRCGCQSDRTCAISGDSDCIVCG